MDTKQQTEEPKSQVSEEQSQQSQNAPVTSRPSRKRPIIITVIIAIAVLTIVAAAAYYLFVVMPTDDAVVDEGTNQSVEFASAEALVESANNELDGTMLNPTELTGMGGVTADGYAAYSLPVYKVSGQQYYTAPSQGVGAGAMAEQGVATASYQDLVAFLADNKYEKQDMSLGSGVPLYLTDAQDVTLKDYGVYASNTIVCTVWNMDISKSKPGQAIASIGCADEADYREVSDNLKVLYDAYAKAAPPKGESVVIGAPEDCDGDDCRYVMVYQEDAAKDAESTGDYAIGYYYKTGEQDSNWTFFTSVPSSQEAFSCSELNSPTLKSAFADVKCS
jgi:hypothetical protein